METIAQTSVQLYNQLRRQDRSAEELALVRDACDLGRSLYCAQFQADGVPFVAHLTGVASVVAQLGLSSDYVAAACLHNVYTNADFGDGRGKCVTVSRRKLVENAVGPEVESLVHRFWTLLRMSKNALLALKERVDTLPPRDRQLMTVDLADTLEICHDLGPLYYGDSEWVVDYVRREGPALVELAESLGHPALAAMLSSSIAALLSETIPLSLRLAKSERKFARLEIPLSCIRRPGITARRKIRRLLRLIRKDGTAASHV